MSEDTHDGSSVSLSELFEILSHEHRRRVLVAVARHNPRDEDEIESKSAVNEHEDDETIELLKQQLYHVHLPKLDESGFVNWDRDAGHVTRGPRFEEIEPLLRLMRDHQDELPNDWP